jgi:suppressor for copper-sensitivity B
MRRFVLHGVIAALTFAGSLSARGNAAKPSEWPGLQGDGWVKTGPAAVRLISEQDGFLPQASATLGVQIKLKPGWWTYWRAPGDAGLPPEFDWSESKNLKWTPELFWPKPLQKTSFGHSIRVYRDEVVFPLRVVAADPGKPLKLKLNLTFGVCKEVCIPNQAKVALELDPFRAGLPRIVLDQRRQIRRFEAEVPKANPQKAGIRIRNVGVVKDAKGAGFLAVELGHARSDAKPLVLIELSPGDPPLIAHSLGRAQAAQTWRFAAGLDESQTSMPALAGRRVRVTIFDGGRSLEQIWVVGASADSSGQFGRLAPGGQPGDQMNPDTGTWKPRD